MAVRGKGVGEIPEKRKPETVKRKSENAKRKLTIGIRPTFFDFRFPISEIKKVVMEERRIKSFEDLEVWQFLRQLRIKFTQLAKRLPPEEKYRLTDQIIRASRSTTNNISEGYGRYHFQENVQFCRHSRGSLYELIDHVITCNDEGYISDTERNEYRADCLRGIQLVNGYIRFLNKQKSQYE
jgi:four helix bundle protein